MNENNVVEHPSRCNQRHIIKKSGFGVRLIELF